MGIQAATHWDALSHVGYDNRLYNDVPADAVTDETVAVDESTAAEAMMPPDDETPGDVLESGSESNDAEQPETESSEQVSQEDGSA